MGGMQHGQDPQQPEPYGPGPNQGYGPPHGAAPPQGYTPPQGFPPPQGYGPPQAYGPPQGYGPPPMAPVEKKKRRKWPWILLGIFLFCVLVYAGTAGGGGEDTESTAGGGGTASEEESVETVGVGEPGEVGSWIVTVNGTETAGVVGDGYYQEQAQGEFVIVDVTVENSGTEATYFDETALSLIDADGNEHSAGYVPGDEEFFVEQINPGNQSSGRAAFDVPEGTEPVALQVEDMLSFEDPLEIRLG